MRRSSMSMRDRFSEPAALIGLLLVAAGVVYLGRGWRATLCGLALAGSGGFLAIGSKEQYLILAVPICLTLVLARAGREARRGGGPGPFRARPTGAAGPAAPLRPRVAAGR